MKRLSNTAKEDRAAFEAQDSDLSREFRRQRAKKFQDNLIAELYGLFFHDIWGMLGGRRRDFIHVRVHPHLMLDIEKAHYVLSRPTLEPSKMEHVKSGNPQMWHLPVGTVHFHSFVQMGSVWPIGKAEIRLLLRPDEVYVGGRIDWIVEPAPVVALPSYFEYGAPGAFCNPESFGIDCMGKYRLSIHPMFATRVRLLNNRSIALDLIKRTQIKDYEPK